MYLGLVTYALNRSLTGIVRYTVELTRALVDLPGGPRVTLLAAGGAGPFGNTGNLTHATLPGCRLLPGLVTLGNAWLPLRARQLDLDLVHDPTGVTPLLFGAGRARTVVTVHDVFAWSCPGHNSLLDTVIYRYWLPRVLPTVDQIITDSHTSQEDITRYLGIPTTKMHVVPLGIGERYRPAVPGKLAAARVAYGLPHPYILFLGSVQKRKNLTRLLRAYACIHEPTNHLPLVIVGARGAGAQRILQLIHELDLEERVIWTGCVADTDLPALYSAAELFVFPSLYEGFGLPPLEAMACGTPVVCSNAASLPEVVGEAAITVDPYDVEALAAAMKQVLSDRDLQEDLRRRGLERAAGFTWARTARETAAVYREVLNS